jgi:hypothetical protein
MVRASSPVGRGKLPRLGVALVAVAALIANILVAFKLLSPSNSDSPASAFDAGPVHSVVPGSIRYFSSQHFYLISQQDGSLLALYDWAA